MIIIFFKVFRAFSLVANSSLSLIGSVRVFLLHCYPCKQIMEVSNSSNDRINHVIVSNESPQPSDELMIDLPEEGKPSQDSVMRRAKSYQEQMRCLPIPTQRGSLIPFSSWTGLGKSIKRLYGQPLHYLTNVLLERWDRMRIGCEDEYKPLDITFHPCKAETTIWLVEEIHRFSTSDRCLGTLWLSDGMPDAYIDAIVPH